MDDVMGDINESISEIVTVSSRHLNCLTLMLLQSLFPPNKHARTISLNARMHIIFANPRNSSSFAVLARQMLGSNYKYAVQAYQKTTETPHGALLVDLSQSTPHFLRFRSHFMPSDKPMRAYAPKSSIISDFRRKKLEE